MKKALVTLSATALMMGGLVGCAAGNDTAMDTRYNTQTTRPLGYYSNENTIHNGNARVMRDNDGPLTEIMDRTVNDGRTTRNNATNLRIGDGGRTTQTNRYGINNHYGDRTSGDRLGRNNDGTIARNRNVGNTGIFGTDNTTRNTRGGFFGLFRNNRNTDNTGIFGTNRTNRNNVGMFGNNRTTDTTGIFGTNRTTRDNVGMFGTNRTTRDNNVGMFGTNTTRNNVGTNQNWTIGPRVTRDGNTRMFGTRLPQDNVGMFGNRNTNNTGIFGTNRNADNTGIFGTNRTTRNNVGIFGTNRTTDNTGIFGTNRNANNTGIFGTNRTTRNNVGIFGTNRTTDNTGIFGTNRNINNPGIFGTNRNTGNNFGTLGLNRDQHANNFGATGTNRYGAQNFYSGIRNNTNTTHQGYGVNRFGGTGFGTAGSYYGGQFGTLNYNQGVNPFAMRGAQTLDHNRHSQADTNYHGHLNDTTNRAKSSDYYNNYGGQLAERIVERVERIDNVDDARAVINGNNVVIAVDTDDNNDKDVTKEVEQSVKTLVRGKDVRVVTDEATYTRVRNLDNDIRNGTTTETITADINNLFENIGQTLRRPFQTNNR